MQVWNVLHAARSKYRTQNSPSGHHHTTLSGYMFTNRKKLVKQHIPSTWSHQYGELRPITGWDRFTSLGHPTKFQRVSRLVFVTAATSLTGGQRNLHGVWPSPGLVHYIYIFRGSCPLTEFCLVQNKLSYIGSVTARHSSSGRQPNFAAWYNEWNYGTFAEGAAYIRLGGHQFEHRPTF